MGGVRHDSCAHKHKYVRTSHGMGSESLSRGVDLFFAQEICSFKQEHGAPSGCNQAKIRRAVDDGSGPAALWAGDSVSGGGRGGDRCLFSRCEVMM